jgi:hypothetical protein
MLLPLMHPVGKRANSHQVASARPFDPIRVTAMDWFVDELDRS